MDLEMLKPMWLKAAPYVIAAAVVLGLVGWAGNERMGKLDAQRDAVVAQGERDLAREQVREINRGVVALGNATLAANARAVELEKQRAKVNAPLQAKIADLEAKLKLKAPDGADCKRALEEARQEVN